MPRAITIVPKPPKLEQKKRVAAYARVSSGKDAMLHSLSAQISFYSDLIQNHDDWLYVGVYADEAKTGTKESRADFQKLIADCRAGKIDMVITKSISRFARNTVTLLQTVRDFKAWEVDIFFEEQNIHTMSSDGELMMTILASYAQEESRSASENQRFLSFQFKYLLLNQANRFQICRWFQVFTELFSHIRRRFFCKFFYDFWIFQCI